MGSNFGNYNQQQRANVESQLSSNSSTNEKTPNSGNTSNAVQSKESKKQKGLAKQTETFDSSGTNIEMASLRIDLQQKGAF